MKSEAVQIDLGDGKPRALKYSGPAVCRMEKANGNRSFFSMLNDEAGFSWYSWMIWGGLLWKEPNLTLDDVAGIIFAYVGDEGSAKLNTLAGPILEAMREAGFVKPAKEKPAKDPQKAKGSPSQSASSTN